MKTASKSILVLILFIGLITVLILFSFLIMLGLGFLQTIVATITQPDDMNYLWYNAGVCNLCCVYSFALDALF